MNYHPNPTPFGQTHKYKLSHSHPTVQTIARTKPNLEKYSHTTHPPSYTGAKHHPLPSKPCVIWTYTAIISLHCNPETPTHPHIQISPYQKRGVVLPQVMVLELSHNGLWVDISWKQEAWKPAQIYFDIFLILGLFNAMLAACISLVTLSLSLACCFLMEKP